MFFPLRDNNPTTRRPYVTVALIAANCLIFLYTRLGGMEGFEHVIRNLGFTPYYYLNMAQVTNVPTWYVLTPLTSMFLHGGWMHLLGNMLFLWIYGNNIEDYFGPVVFLFFYVIAGLAAVALYTVFNTGSEIPLVGASGAIAGVMGAYMVLHPRAEITCLIVFFFIQFVTLPAKAVLGIWFALQIIMSFTGMSSGGGVAWLAHVGGFLFGLILLWILVKIRGTNPPGRQRVYKVQW